MKRILLLGLLAVCSSSIVAQSAIPALFVSDIHYDPLRDPALAPRLNAAPAAQWAAILATPPSATLAADAEAVQKACPVRGNDPDQALWQSSLQAIRAQAGDAKFIVLSGDLLPHNFDCRYKFLFPKATHADFLNFAENTLRYVVTSLRAAMPGVPLYTALGNNDTACGGNKLDPENDFLGLTAKVIAETYPKAERKAILKDVAAGGYYSVPMSGAMRHTRMIVVDDLFFLTELSTCEGKKEYVEEPAQLAWFAAQMAAARRRHETVWVLGHIPPGVSLYTTFTSKKRDICGSDAPAMSLNTEGMAQTMAANADIVKLAVFAHTHSDAFGLIQPNLGEPQTPAMARLGPGVPMKVVASISAVNGNNPSFTLATIDPATATLRDYTVIEASNLSGVDATWTKQYTYSEDYQEPDFSAVSLAGLIAEFRADPTASMPASQAYLEHHYSTGATPSQMKASWPVYVCAMDHDSGKSFAGCACASGAVPPVR